LDTTRLTLEIFGEVGDVDADGVVGVVT
jgi:hypothetical protein